MTKLIAMNQRTLKKKKPKEPKVEIQELREYMVKWQKKLKYKGHT